MAVLTTGLIENNPVSGIRPSSTLTVRLRNKDLMNAVVQIRGFYLKGTAKIEYVLDSITLAPGRVVDTHHYAQFDALEFRFITSSDEVEVLAWGKNDVGNMTVSYHLVPMEIIPPGMGANEQMDTVSADRIYVANSSSNNVSVIERKTNALITSVTVGIRPKAVGVNPVTNRIYVTNQGSNNVSVIDGLTHVVLATILVGESPEELNIDSKTDRIYVTNHGSNNVSVISGRTHTVIATL